MGQKNREAIMLWTGPRLQPTNFVGMMSSSIARSDLDDDDRLSMTLSAVIVTPYCSTVGVTQGYK